MSAPEPDTAETQIARIDQLTRVGRANWLGLLAYLIFAFVTVLSVEDADFFIPARQTTLPLVGVDIPTFSFFAFAPILGVALYVYLHLHVRKQIEALCEPQAEIQGQPLESRIAPWLLNDIVLMARRQGAAPARAMDWLVKAITVGLVWLAGPLALGAFWWRSVPANAEGLTLLLGGCFLLSVYAGLESWVLLHRLTRRQNTALARLKPGPIKSAAAALVVIGASWLSTEGGLARYVPDWEDTAADFPPVKVAPVFLPADLSEVVFATLPPDQIDRTTARHRYRDEWCARQGVEAEICGRLPSYRTEDPPHQARIRKNWCADRPEIKDCPAWFTARDNEFRAEWQAYRAAQLAALDAPDLRGKDLRGANLSLAALPGVLLTGARMEGAVLREARMEGANLSWARMEGADLREARMEGADLSWAWMEGAYLREARMEGANLSWARMEGAVLIEARMEGANLSWALLKSVKWAGAQTRSPAHFTDFRGSDDLTQDQLDQVIGNARTLLPTGLHVWTCWADPPPEIDAMAERAANAFLETRSAEDFKRDWLCPDGSEPEPTGTQLGPDETPAWEVE